jgi:hypothetical protein
MQHKELKPTAYTNLATAIPLQKTRSHLMSVTQYLNRLDSSAIFLAGFQPARFHVVVLRVDPPNAGRDTAPVTLQQQSGVAQPTSPR